MLVTQYGRAALRPDWIEEGYGSVQQLRDSRGRLRWIWDDPKNRTGTKRPMLGFIGEQRESVDFHRAQYRVWWQGLADIVEPLNNRLERHLATGPKAARSPWNESAVPTVFAQERRLDDERAAHKIEIAAERKLNADLQQSRLDDTKALLEVVGSNRAAMQALLSAAQGRQA
jgi:hypothetical protein